jgi:hypothetical protein
VSAPPKNPPSSELSDAEWSALYQKSFNASSRLLTWLQEELGEGPGLNPQLVGTTLLIAMGRLSGRYGYRHLGPEASWQAWTSADLAPLFAQVFRGERAGED